MAENIGESEEETTEIKRDEDKEEKDGNVRESEEEITFTKIRGSEEGSKKEGKVEQQETAIDKEIEKGGKEDEEEITFTVTTPTVNKEPTAEKGRVRAKRTMLEEEEGIIYEERTTKEKMDKEDGKALINTIGAKQNERGVDIRSRETTRKEKETQTNLNVNKELVVEVGRVKISMALGSGAKRRENLRIINRCANTQELSDKTALLRIWRVEIKHKQEEDKVTETATADMQR